MKFLIFLKKNGIDLFAAFLLLGCTSTNLPAAAGLPLRARIDSIIQKERCNSTEIGILVQDVAIDSTLVAINPEKPFIPASLNKLVTAAAGFELLGLSYCCSTSVYIDGPFNRDSGAVRGNLMIRGNGDPGFTAERMWLFVQHLCHQGVRSIEKDLVLDDFFFDSLTMGPGFEEENSSRAYDAPTAALAANFNSTAVHVAPAGSIGAVVHVMTFPPISGVVVTSTAKR
jgi:serine-type D-Ala-D-Ala carboxypeptidase/endopeptidase (penicillin-binding protein 4)